jgi:hypothetical protein
LDTLEEIHNLLQRKKHKVTQSTQEVNIETTLQQEKTMKRIHKWEIQDYLNTKNGHSRKHYKTEVIIDDDLEEESQPEIGTLAKFQK